MNRRHPPVDEYLEAIFGLEEEGEELIQARLAERLGISAPAVSEMVRRLRGDGYLQDNPRALELTEKGRRWATTIVRRHHLAERLLTDVLGVPWHSVHDEACRWEHVISPDVEELLVAKLGRPATCPHGNPIPGMTRPRRHAVPLTTTAEGDVIRLERVAERLEADQETLAYLSQHRFLPGATGVVRTVAPDGTRLIALEEDCVISVGTFLASHLFVTPLPAPTGSAGIARRDAP